MCLQTKWVSKDTNTTKILPRNHNEMLIGNQSYNHSKYLSYFHQIYEIEIIYSIYSFLFFKLLTDVNCVIIHPNQTIYYYVTFNNVHACIGIGL